MSKGLILYTVYKMCMLLMYTHTLYVCKIVINLLVKFITSY